MSCFEVSSRQTVSLRRIPGGYRSGDQAAARRFGCFQFHGSNSASRPCGMSAIWPSTSASHACGSTSLSLAVIISVVMAAARPAPRSEPAKSHDFLPSANPRRARSAALFVRQTPAIFDESGKPVPTLEHVVDWLGDRGRARQARVLLTQPRFQSSQKGRALFLAYAQTLFGAQAVDVALDVE